MKRKIFTLLLIAALFLVSCGNGVTETVDYTDKTDVQIPLTHVHAYAEYVTVEPTCTSYGVLAYGCECGDVQWERALPLAKHDANEAFCGVDSVCKTCGQILTEKYEHVLDVKTVTEKTCTEDGVKKAVCHRCGYSEEIVVKASHSFKKIDKTDGVYVGVCEVCSHSVSGISVEELHNEKECGLTFTNGNMKFVGGGTRYSYILSDKITGDKAPYQIDFTLTLNQGATKSSETVKLNNSGSGRNLLTCDGTYYSLLRQYPVSDGNGGYLSDTVKIGSLVSWTQPMIPLTEIKVGESVRFSFAVNPSQRTVDIYVNGEYMTTREGTGALPDGLQKIRFGDGEASPVGYTVSDFSIIRVFVG